MLTPQDYANIAQLISESSRKNPNPYDVLWVDDVWLYGLARNGLLQRLNAMALRDMPDFKEAYTRKVRNAEAMLSHQSAFDSEEHCSLKDEGECDLWMIPQRVDVQVLFYNRMIFEDPGIRAQYRKRSGQDLRIPITWDEYEFVAKNLHGLRAPFGDVVGCAETLGVPHYSVDFFVSRYWSMLDPAQTAGESDLFGWRDGRREPVFQQQAGIQTIDHFRRLQPYWAQDSDIADHSRTISRFARGDVALCPQWYTFCADSELSHSLGDNVGIALLPGTQHGTFLHRTPSIGGGGLAIPSNARDVEKSWAYIRYVTGETFCRLAALRGSVVARHEVHHDPATRSRFPAVNVYLESLQLALKRPRLRGYTGIETLLGTWFNAAIIDQEKRPAAAYLRDAASQARLVMQSSETESY
jgi:ABC-type glycerol-3-phosphate transport system substrate-binding protein